MPVATPVLGDDSAEHVQTAVVKAYYIAIRWCESVRLWNSIGFDVPQAPVNGKGYPIPHKGTLLIPTDIVRWEQSTKFREPAWMQYESFRERAVVQNLPQITETGNVDQRQDAQASPTAEKTDGKYRRN